MSRQLARISQLSLLSPVLEIADREVALGGMGGGLLFLLLGALLGARNRGFAGAVIGAVSAMIAGILLGGLAGSLFTSRQGEVEADFDLEERPSGYSPGGTLTGYVRLSPKRSGRIAGGKVLLVCRGFYTYDAGVDESSGEPRLVRDVKTLHVQELPVIPAATVRRGSPVRYPFRFALPERLLPTHHGFACSVRWSLHVDLGAESGSEGSHEIFVQAVAPVGVGARSERVSTSSPVGELVLALPRTTYAEGETLQGRVIVNPGEDFVASEVRALLLRVEHNPRGDDHVVYITGWNPDTGRFRGESRPGGEGTTYVWLEDEADLAEHVHVSEGEKRLFDFSFQLPQQWRPTFQTEHGDVAWRVVAVLSRPNGRDMRVQQGITVHTGAPHIARVLAPEMGLGGEAEVE
jgi:hypothetical protein